MAATLTRRALRRARLGGRHTYRTAVRHRVPLLVAAAAIAAASVVVGVAGEAGHDGPRFGPGADQVMHGPMGGHMDGRMGAPLGGPPDGPGPGGPGRG